MMGVVVVGKTETQEDDNCAFAGTNPAMFFVKRWGGRSYWLKFHVKKGFVSDEQTGENN